MRFAVVGLCMLLASCAAIAPPGPARQPATRVARLQALDQWTLQGRIAIQVSQENWTGTLRWHQQGDEYRIRFIAPLGQGTAEITGGRRQVVLRTSRGERYTAADAGALLARRLGWRLPVSSLRYWVLGVPDPRFPAHVELNDDGRVQRLAQEGWDLRFERYRRFGRFALPVRLQGAAGRLQVRLVVEHWRLSGADPQRAR